MEGRCRVIVSALLVASTLATVHAQISTREQQAEQDAIDARTPKLNYKEDVLQLLVPGYTMGETVCLLSHQPTGGCPRRHGSHVVGIRPGRQVREGMGAP